MLLQSQSVEQKTLIGYNKDDCDLQLKLIIEWIAASAIGVPLLVYSTHGTNKLSLANIVTCSLLDKNCTISELFAIILEYIEQNHHANCNPKLFDILMKFSNKNNF